MQSILVVTLPFFALVLLGYVAAQRRLLSEAAIPGLNAYVLFFALPCLLFRFGSSMPLAQLIDPVLMGIYALCSLIIVTLTIGATLRRGAQTRGVDLKNAAFGALVAAFPNSGFMGVPLLVALFGQSAAGPVISTLLFDMVITSAVCLTLAQTQQKRSNGEPHGSVLTVVGRSFLGAATNPQPWAILLGALAAGTAFQLPGPITQVVRMLADSASPVALFTIGAVLWRARQHTHTRTALRDYLPVALIKLLVHPLLVGVAGLGARAAGFQVPGFGLTVMIMAAALPSASGVSMLAERYGADNGRVARIIMASTVLAFGSFSAIAWRFGGHAL